MTHDDPHRDDALDDPRDEEEAGGPALVTCGLCGHPNLAFRNHCRRCGATLTGATNLLPGVDLIEWTATDGPDRRDKEMGTGVVLLFLVVCVAVPVAGLVAAQMRSPVAGFALLLVAVMVAGSLLLRRGERPGHEDDAPAPAEPAPQCHACGAEIARCDDICPECGALVAPDFLS